MGCTCWVSCQTERKYFLGVNNILLWKQRFAFVCLLIKMLTFQIMGLVDGLWILNIFLFYHLGHKKEKRGKRKGLIAVSFHCICTKRRQNVGLPPTSWPQKLPSFPEQCNQSLPSGPQIRRKLEKFGLFMWISAYLCTQESYKIEPQCCRQATGTVNLWPGPHQVVLLCFLRKTLHAESRSDFPVPFCNESKMLNF